MSKLTPRQEADAASRAPGYWPNWREPTKMAAAIQTPLNDAHWQDRVIAAYVTRSALSPTAGERG